MTHRRFLWQLVLVASLVGASCSGDGEGLASVAVADPGAAEFDYSIPAGTGDRLDRGETVELLPGEIDAEVGDVIRIVNDDDEGHLLGPFYVGAHETMVQRFSAPGEFVGMCAVHPSGELVVRVVDP